MKLLFDEDLSHKLVSALADLFPDSAHTCEIGLASADDQAVWDFAKANGYTIVSKDEDFHQRSFLHGHPPKVVWLRVGNCATQRIHDPLRSQTIKLIAFDADPQSTFLILQ